jgi:hypothetical protein
MDFIDALKTNQAFTYAKYGDGEYLCAIKRPGQNCDNTKYTEKLSNAVIKSYKYLAPQSNCYIGRWTDGKVDAFFERIVKPNWRDYSQFIFFNKKEFYEKLDLFRSIKQATQQKIYCCNADNAKAAPIFNIDTCVIVHPSDWFESTYEAVLAETKAAVINPDSVIILTSAGMGAKPLMADLRQCYPNAILIDIGSAFDTFVYRKSRSHNLNFTKSDIDEFIKSLTISE